jgi:hypothetical protein
MPGSDWMPEKSGMLLFTCWTEPVCLKAGANPTTKTGLSTCPRSFRTSLFLLRQGACAMDFIQGKRDKEGKLAALGLTKTEFVCRS